jgi:hypothetical protein
MIVLPLPHTTKASDRLTQLARHDCAGVVPDAVTDTRRREPLQAFELQIVLSLWRITDTGA